MSSITYTHLRAELANAMDQVNEDHAPLYITQQNDKSAVLVSADDHISNRLNITQQAVLETIYSPSQSHASHQVWQVRKPLIKFGMKLDVIHGPSVIDRLLPGQFRIVNHCYLHAVLIT